MKPLKAFNCREYLLLLPLSMIHSKIKDKVSSGLLLPLMEAFIPFKGKGFIRELLPILSDWAVVMWVAIGAT